MFETDEQKPLKPTKYDCDAREASDTFIDDYFDVEDWFSNIQNETGYRVEIEKCENDYPLSFPFLVKATAQNSAEVFESLSTKYIISKGEPSFVKYQDIVAETDGKCHLLASNNPKSNPDNLAKCTNSIMRDMADLLRFQIGYNEHKKSKRVDCFPTDYYLKQMDKDYLLESASLFGIPVKASESRENLAKKIRAFLVNPLNLERALLTLTDNEIAIFDKIVNNPCIEVPEDALNSENVIFCTSIITINTGQTFVPVEIASFYKELNIPQLQNKRRQAQWILNITDTILAWYYGYMPLKNSVAFAAVKRIQQ